MNKKKSAWTFSVVIRDSETNEDLGCLTGAISEHKTFDGLRSEIAQRAHEIAETFSVAAWDRERRAHGIPIDSPMRAKKKKKE